MHIISAKKSITIHLFWESVNQDITTKTVSLVPVTREYKDEDQFTILNGSGYKLNLIY